MACFRPAFVIVGTLCLVASCNNSSSGSSSSGATNPPDNLVYLENPANYQVGTPIADNVPTVTGPVTSYTAAPALPPGLSINGITGVISGTPTEARIAAIHTVTATNSAGSTTADLDITVIDIPPSTLTYSDPNPSYSAGIPITPNVPTVTGNVDTYLSNPPLPPGLDLDATTGVISGAATVGLSSGTFTITATNSGGSTSVDLRMTVLDYLPKPGGGRYFYDFNSGGNASELRIAEVFWGRLVDVHDVDANGDASPMPVFRDFVINENILTDGTNFELETNPITQEQRLIILRTSGAPNTGSGTFEDLLRQAMQGLVPIVPKNDDGTDPEPFSILPRNACLVIRCDDLLDDDATALMELPETVKILTGYPPSDRFDARLLFDANHGGEAGGVFHSTRILVDMTVSETEAAEMSMPLPVNLLGLPSSAETSGQPNVSVRIPSRVDAGSGQFEVLRNLSGAAMTTVGNGPVDLTSPTEDVVRAMRSGNRTDANNGFHLDLQQPEIVGGWPMTVLSAVNDPAGMVGFDLIVDVRFETSCADSLRVEDIVTVNGFYLAVTLATAPPDGTGQVVGVRVRVNGTNPVANLTDLLGVGLLMTPYDPGSSVPLGCWVSFVPEPVGVASNVSPFAQVRVRFSEPMDPACLVPFESFTVVEGAVGTTPDARNTVVGEVTTSTSLREFSFTPLLPFSHVNGTAEDLHLLLSGAKDLAGNAVANELPPVGFTMEAGAATAENESIVFRFASVDEIGPGGGADGLTDWRGQFTYDLSRQIMQPRPVTYSQVPADTTQPIPGLMLAFPAGTMTPLSPLGSKLQATWRYVDVGWSVRDETKYNVDVVGLNWSPVGGQVLSDFYEEFEIRLSHSSRLPDEFAPNGVVNKPLSGLFGSPNFFTENILVDPLSPQKVVHNRALGYEVNPVDLFAAPSGTQMMPFPLNRGGDPTETYTWRDTTVLAVGGADSNGIPMPLEVALGLETNPTGTLGAPGAVPSFGLPLLMEFRCFPSNSGIGLNTFDVSLAVATSSRPNFRAYSTGGVDTSGAQVVKNPDLELVPSGGFNPASAPSGQPTANDADNFYYVGQLDIVIRVSRVHSAWLYTLIASPQFLDPVIAPHPADQPGNSEIIVEYRGADGFVGAGNAPFDAAMLDPYGEFDLGSVTFHNGVSTWTDNIADVDGAMFIQLRLSFLNDIEAMASPELSGLGLVYTGD